MASRAGDGPADTRLMAIVHGALRRDLERARRELLTRPYPAGHQRQAIGQHVRWLMDVLHHHHTGEDEGLWPLVRARNPAAADVLDSLEADHRRLAPAISALSASAAAYGAGTEDPARLALVEALDRLHEVLVPHLDREVAEGMPVVSKSITDREWRAVDKRYNVKPKSLRQLGLEGHLLLDGIDDESRRVVEQVVPPVARFILLHGFARAYRRMARARWRAETGAGVLPR